MNLLDILSRILAAQRFLESARDVVMEARGGGSPDKGLLFASLDQAAREVNAAAFQASPYQQSEPPILDQAPAPEESTETGSKSIDLMAAIKESLAKNNPTAVPPEERRTAPRRVADTLPPGIRPVHFHDPLEG